jgi:transcriptional regulator with XRE-family HTH domain
MRAEGETFRGLLLRLRGRIGLTQRELATRVGVNVSSIQGWEGGANYPSVASLKPMIATLLRADGFTAGREAEEADCGACTADIIAAALAAARQVPGVGQLT